MDLTTPMNGNHIVDIGGSGNVEIEATNVDLLYVSSADINGNMNTADSDVLVNAEHLYGQGKGLFGMDLLDVDYSGYDVVTSALLSRGMVPLTSRFIMTATTMPSLTLPTLLEGCLGLGCRNDGCL